MEKECGSLPNFPGVDDELGRWLSATERTTTDIKTYPKIQTVGSGWQHFTQLNWSMGCLK